jgi:hypothetical protein
MMSWKGCGRKQPIQFEVLSCNLCEGTEENHENVTQDSQDLNWAPYGLYHKCGV